MKYNTIPHDEIIKGVKSWKNPNNQFQILAIHYSADPEKDAERDGKEWFEAEQRGMPKEKWSKEYELDFESKEGQLIFGSNYCDFSPGVHFIDSKPITGELLLSMDFGQSNPNAGLIGCYDRNGVLYIINEYYKPAIPSVASREMFEHFAGHMGLKEGDIASMDFDAKRDAADSAFQIKVIDPTTRSKNRTKVKGGEEIPYSVHEDFYDNGWDFELGNNDWDASITRIREYFQLDKDGKSHLYIFKDKCPKLCWELQRYKYKEHSTSKVREYNALERPVKRDDHAVDSLRMLMMTRPSKPTVSKEAKTAVQLDMERCLNKPSNTLTQIWDLDG